LNMFKCNLASLWFLIMSLVTRLPSTNPFPSTIFTLDAVGFLFVSSTLGIVLGDVLWLEALRLLGVRRVIVVDTLKPFVAALLGWTILGEQLPLAALGGMVLTVGGVFLVSREQHPTTTTTTTMEVESGVVVVQVDHHHPTEDHEDDDHENAVPPEDDTQQQSIVTTGMQSDPYKEDQLTTSNLETAVMRKPMEGTSAEGGDETSAEKSAETFDVQDDAVTNMEIAISVQTPLQGSLRETRTNSITSLRRGYVMAAINVILDTYGSVLTKQYGKNMSTWDISLLRFGFAGIVLLLVSLFMSIRAWWDTRGVHTKFTLSSSSQQRQNVTDHVVTWYTLPINMSRMAWFKIVIGVALVTFLAPALSNYALFQIALALALTLGSLGPIYSLPLSWLLQQDQPTMCASIGAALAVAGVIVLSFVGTL
jgi:drug/metabolite transporter (DMT)-like permease